MKVTAAVLGLMLALLPPLALAQDEPEEAAPAAAPAPPANPKALAGVAEATPKTAAPGAQVAASAVAAAAPPKPAEAPAPAPPGARLAPGQPIPPAELAAFVDGYVHSAMARAHIAGATVSVVQNGQVVLRRGYGYASFAPARPVDPDRTLFRIGSISKTFTWIAVMKAVEAGRLRLDQPINSYLPDGLKVPDQGYETPIRVINLMDHSPGFEDRPLGNLFERDFDQVRPLEVYLAQARPRRVRAPGVASSYSNYGAALAGEAAARVSGKPFERMIEDEILVPAALSHTTFREPHAVKAGLPAPMPAALARDVADGYRWAGGGFQRRPYEYIEQIAPAGAASSTAGDMARYMLLLLNGGSLDGATIYGPATAKAFATPIQATPPGINGWAHGFALRTLPGGFQAFGHDGGTLSFFSDMTLAPQLGLGVFVSTNSEGGPALSGALAPAIVRQFYAPPEGPPRGGSPALAAQAEVFDGHYLSTRRPYFGLQGFVMRLANAGITVKVTPDGRLVVAAPGGAHAFVPDGPVEAGRFVSAQEDEGRLLFDIQDGRAMSFRSQSNASRVERAGWWSSPPALELLAALTAYASIATLVGLAARNRRDLRENMVQTRASLVQNIQAGLWLAAMILLGLWAARAVSDTAWVMYTWPGTLLILASTCALVAAALTVPTLAALPGVWSGGRRVDSWSNLRKVFFTVTVAIYVAFAILLGSLGALLPWSG